MNIEDIKELMLHKPGLSSALGMEFISTPDPDTCMARMKVDDRTRQPFGLLSGGATLALAENLAGVGSMGLRPDKMGLGINVSGTHVKGVPMGEFVTATARIIHAGNTLHQWHIDVHNEKGQLVSSIEVTNFLIDRPKSV